MQNNDTIIVSLQTVKKPKNSPSDAIKSGSVVMQKKRKSAVGNHLRKGTDSARKVGIHTLESKKNVRTTPKSFKVAKKGVRLGETLESSIQDEESATKVQQNRPKRARVDFSSKEDVETKLLRAVSPDGSNTNASKFFRATTRNAVDYQYQITRANARLHAALSNHFNVTSGSDISDENNDGRAMIVKYKEGVRKWSEEKVSMLQPVELHAILKYVLLSGGETGREMLKPFNMAQCSPRHGQRLYLLCFLSDLLVMNRVFWNLARLYNGDVAQGLLALLPGEDWSFLDVRTR